MLEDFKKSCKGKYSEEDIKKVSLNMLFKSSFMKEVETNLLDLQKNKGELFNTFSSMYNLSNLNSLSNNSFIKFQGFNNNLGINNFDAEFNEFAELSGGNSGLHNYQNLFKSIGSNLPGFNNQELNNNFIFNLGNNGSNGNGNLNSNLNSNINGNLNVNGKFNMIINYLLLNSMFSYLYILFDFLLYFLFHIKILLY